MVKLVWIAATLLVVVASLASPASSDPAAPEAGGGAATAAAPSGKRARALSGPGILTVRAGGAAARSKAQRSKFPLKGGDGAKKTKRAGECRLAKSVYEIGDSWSPDLGEPFGTMYCIQCACEAVQRKRRVVGRVKCRNVKSDCPALDCPDATSVPGQCCKVCPETLNATEGAGSDATDDIDIAENNKEYAALLTPRSSTLIRSSLGLGEPLPAGVGSARFLFLQKSLYYSFVHNDALARPKYVQFVDGDGNVVEEQEVTLNNYQQDTKKICGVWQRIPRVYRKLLKEEKLWAALVTEKIGGGDNDRFIAGKISKQRYMATELYSSLLEPSTQVGTGGMAVVSVSASTGSIYLGVTFNGDFEEDRNITIAVRVSDGTGVSVDEFVRIPKINYDTNTIEVRGILEPQQLTALTRGTLFVVVYSPRNPDFKLIGFIQARTTCDIFDSVLTPETSAVRGTGIGGIAWVYPLPDGSWSYNVQLPEEHTPLSLKMETGRKVLEELSIPLSNNVSRQAVTGMSSRYYQLLYEGNIFLSIVTDKATLRGRLVYRGFGDAQQSDAPLMLLPGPGNKPTGDNGEITRAQGLVWVGIDEDCNMNYQLTLSERPQSEMLRIEVMEMPGLHRIGLPVRSYVLADFESSEYEGVYQDIHKQSFAHLKAGDALFKVIGMNNSKELATTVIQNVRVPVNCLPTTGSENVINPDYTLEPEDPADAQTLPNNKCFYDGQLREEYTQWTPANDTCRVCTCYKGQAKCEDVVCPATDCVNPVLLTGECCRTCLAPKMSKAPPSQQRGCDIEGDRFHPAGTSWHPYMPPDGFMVCTTCTCSADNLTVSCTREKCPPLKCSPEEAVYPRPLACCKVCPPPKKLVDEAVMDERDLPRAPSESEVLSQGGCKFRGELHFNGEEWNHRIEPFGYMPCVTCLCRNGETKCGRKKCPALTCAVKVQEEGGCCQKCADVQPTDASLKSSYAAPSSGASSSSSTTTHTKKSKHRTRTRAHQHQPV